MDYKCGYMRNIFFKSLIILISIFISITNLAYAKDKEINYKKIDTYLKDGLEKAHIPGASIIFVNKDEVLFSNTYGNCKNINDTFILGSTTKSFTAVAIMQLVEEGKVDLNESASKYLPKRNLDKKVTVKNLLNHTSGIETYSDPNNFKVTNLYGNPNYSNLNYTFLGEIIENVSKMDYEKYISEKIFNPIGMKNSYTSIEEAKKNTLIKGYRNYFGFMVPMEMPYPNSKGNPWISLPAGYIISSSYDMGKYLQMYMRGGENVISESSINSLFYDGVKINKNTNYAMGWQSTNRGNETVVEHTGLVENYMAYMFILPKSNIGCMMLFNANDYFVANKMLETIGEGVVLVSLGEKPREVGDTYYRNTHMKYNIIYLCVFIVSILPLIFIRKWNKKNGNKKNFVGLGLLHFILPTILIIFPKILGVKMFVVKGYVPDLYLVLIISALILYLTGIIKIILTLRKHKV